MKVTTNQLRRIIRETLLIESNQQYKYRSQEHKPKRSERHWELN